MSLDMFHDDAVDYLIEKRPMKVDVTILVSYETDAPDVMAEADRLQVEEYRRAVLSKNGTQIWVNAVEEA